LLKSLPLLLACLAVSAQDVSEEMSVILRETRLHVIDRDGNPVRGLTRDDFQIEENGIAQDLTWFREVDYEGLTMQPGRVIQKVDRPRRVSVLVLDTANMITPDFEALLEATKAFIREDLSSEDLVKIVHLDGVAESLTQFTNDKEALLAGLETAVYRGSFRRELASIENEVVSLLPEFQRWHSDVIEWEGLAARSTGQARQNAQREADRFKVRRDAISRQIDHEVSRKEYAKANHYRSFFLQMQYIARMLAPVDGTRSIFLMSGGLYLEDDPEYAHTKPMAARLGRLLNNNAITVYALHQATRLSQAEGQLKMSESPVRLERFQQIGSLVSEFSDTPTGKLRTPANTVLENQRQAETGIRAAAEESGGFFQRGLRGNLGEMLDRARSNAAHFYLLGYQVDGSNAADKARLEIRLREPNEDLRLVYGREFAKDISYRDLPEDEQEIVFKADLLHAIRRRDDLPASVDGTLFGLPEGGYRVVVTARLEREAEATRYDVGFAALDANREPLDFAFTSLRSLPEGDRLDLYDVLLTEKRPEYIRFAVRNPTNNAYSVLETILPAGTPGATETRLSGLVIAGDARKTVPLHRIRVRTQDERGLERAGDGQARRIEQDPLTLGERTFRPNGAPQFQAPEKLDVFFHLEKYTDPDPKLLFQFLVKAEAGISGPPMEMVHQERIDEGTVFYHCRLDLTGLAPDRYEIWLRVTDRTAEQAYMTHHVIEIAAN